MTQAPVKPEAGPYAPRVGVGGVGGRGDAIDQWLSMFTRFLRLPPEQSRAIKDELDSHVRERVRDLMLAGLNEDEGVRRAIDELGEAAELAAHFRAAHRPNRRMLMSIAAIGVAAGAAVISVVALTQAQPAPKPDTTPRALESREVEPEQGVPVLANLPIVNRFFVPLTHSAHEQLAPPVRINFKSDAPTVRTLANLLAEGTGRRLSLNAGELDVDKPLKAVELVDADVATLMRVINERAQLNTASRLEVRLRDGVVEVAPTEVFDKAETSLVAYDLTAALNSSAKSDDLVETVTQFVETDGWRDNGGETARLKVVGNKMFVEAPPRYHERVAWILDQFSNRASAPVNRAAPKATAPAPAAGTINMPGAAILTPAPRAATDAGVAVLAPGAPAPAAGTGKAGAGTPAPAVNPVGK